MIESGIRLATGALLAAIITGICACTPAANDATTESASTSVQPNIPRYVSNKQVSTDCGVEATPPPPPGFAHRPNAKIVEMTTMLAGRRSGPGDRSQKPIPSAFRRATF